MSDDALVFIPSDHRFIPHESTHAAAVKLLQDVLLPSPRTLMWQDVDLRIHDRPEPVVALGNFVAVHCPFCNRDLSDWWIEQVGIAAQSRHVKLAARVPCCGTVTSLNHLNYQYPQGFARFEVEVQNPRFDKFQPELVNELEEVLGCGIRVIYQHF